MRSAQSQSRGIGYWTIHTGVWILVGLLLITIAIIFSAREERSGFPSFTSTRASGISAFAELLKRDGYIVRLDRSVRPRFEKGEVVIAVTRGTLYDDESFELPVNDSNDGLHKFQIEEHLESGGRVIELIHSANFHGNSEDAERSTRSIVKSSDPTKKLSISIPGSNYIYTAFDVWGASYDAWMLAEESFVSYTTSGDGLLVTVKEGLPLTNRYLDERQNAEFGLELVRSVAPSGSTLVFDESGIGNAEAPTVANTLGQWAVAARWQAVILFIVLIYTFSRRFGLPERDFAKVRSSRELFDAVADVFRRTSNTQLALDNLLIECDQRIRRVLRASSDTKRSEILQMVPSGLRDQYFIVSEHANARSSPQRASIEAAKLLSLLNEFEHDSRSVRGLKR